MKAIPIHEAKANLSKYIQQAKAGKPVYIGGFGNAEVMLTVIPRSKHAKKRDFSSMKAKIWAEPDAFSDETEQEIADLLLNNGEL